MQSIQEEMRSLLQDRMPAGAAAAVAARVNDELWQAALNIPAADGPAPPRERQFLAYSITKSFIATLVLQSCEAGRLRLDAPLARWFPWIPRADEIPLRRLLNHTAGIPDYRTLEAYHRSLASSPSCPWSFDEFAAQTYERGLAYPPGQGWDSSSPGYMLLRRILERETGEPLASLLDARILKPLGLRQTFFPETTQDLVALVPAYSKLVTTTGEAIDVRSVYHPGWVSDGVLASTPRDVVEFYHCLFAGALLSAETLADMTTLVPVPNEPPTPWVRRGYGLGLMGDAASRHGPLFGHDGEGPGYAASAFHAPASHGGRATVCVMCAVEDSDIPRGIVFELLDLLAQ
jgi:D-alanyl-D-alanine carboxypeptidase